MQFEGTNKFSVDASDNESIHESRMMKERIVALTAGLVNLPHELQPTFERALDDLPLWEEESLRTRVLELEEIMREHTQYKDGQGEYGVQRERSEMYSGESWNDRLKKHYDEARDAGRRAA